MVHKRGTRAYYREIDFNLRKETIFAYGGKCKFCGFSDSRALQIDHINGGGRKEIREKFKKSSRGFLYWLKKNNFPSDEYQLLCANCNQIKRHTNKEGIGPRDYTNVAVA